MGHGAGFVVGSGTALVYVFHDDNNERSRNTQGHS